MNKNICHSGLVRPISNLLPMSGGRIPLETPVTLFFLYGMKLPFFLVISPQDLCCWIILRVQQDSKYKPCHVVSIILIDTMTDLHINT